MHRESSGRVGRTGSNGKDQEELEKAEMDEFNHHGFFVDEKRTEYLKDPKEPAS